ncbi:MAG: CD3324 family protein [Thermoleophilia bacterium]
MTRRYQNAADVLPPSLLVAVQRHAAGTQLYVPRKERLGWGERSGARQALTIRNRRIRRRRRDGASIEQLMAEFHLGYDSIRKIIGTAPGADAGDTGTARPTPTGKNTSTSSRG